MNRDNLFCKNRNQLEFIVDNQTVAGLCNCVSPIRNSYYKPVVDRMRLTLFRIYHTFEHKAGIFDSHDWRPREFNTPPDVVCNWTLDVQTDHELNCDERVWIPYGQGVPSRSFQMVVFVRAVELQLMYSLFIAALHKQGACPVTEVYFWTKLLPHSRLKILQWTWRLSTPSDWQIV